MIHQTEWNENETLLWFLSLCWQLFATPHTEINRPGSCCDLLCVRKSISSSFCILIFRNFFCYISEFLSSRKICIYICWQKKIHTYMIYIQDPYTSKLYSRPTNRSILINTENWDALPSPVYSQSKQQNLQNKNCVGITMV